MMGVMSKPKVIIGAVAAVVVLAVVGTFAFIKIYEDPQEKLTLDDAFTTTTVAGAPAPTAPAASALTSLDGRWVPAAGSKVQYRVKESLFGQDVTATGTGTGITGSLIIAGTKATNVDIVVDMKTFSSGRDQRDGQVENRIMEVSTHPTATFTLTKPIEFGTVPKEGATVDASATGDLTIRGVKKAVTFPVQAKLNGATIGVAGTIPFNFDDYKIPNPSGGPATISDTGGEMVLAVAFAKQ